MPGPSDAAVIHIEKGSLGFAAAHFSCLGGGRELLHGHNYTVGVRVTGTVQPEGAVIDFVVLKEAVRAECEALDHRVLVPTRSPDCRVEETADGHVSMVYHDSERFLFPRGDCVLLPLPNSTCECLAAHIAGRLRARLGSLPVRLEVVVEESPGQGAAVAEP